MSKETICVSSLLTVTLYEKLNELGEKKQSLLDEMEKENKGTPAEERERLLKQVNLPATVWEKEKSAIGCLHCFWISQVTNLLRPFDFNLIVNGG